MQEQEIKKQEIKDQALNDQEKKAEAGKLRDRIIDNILTIMLYTFLALPVLAIPIAYWPHYEKEIYEETAPITEKEIQEMYANQEGAPFGIVLCDYTGYPTEGMQTEMKSYEQFLELENKAICLEVDGKNLKATGVYKRAFEIEPGQPEYIKGFLKSLFYRTKAIYAQYYVLTLEDGSKVLILLNDTVIDIPKNGRIQLPCGEVSHLWLDEKDIDVAKMIFELGLKHNREKSYLNVIDASTQWMFYNKELKAAQEQRAAIAVIAFWTGIIGTAVMFIWAVTYKGPSKRKKGRIPKDWDKQ